METIGNFLTQPNKDFPLDCDTLDMLQAARHLWPHWAISQATNLFLQAAS